MALGSLIHLFRLPGMRYVTALWSDCGHELRTVNGALKSTQSEFILMGSRIVTTCFPCQHVGFSSSIIKHQLDRSEFRGWQMQLYIVSAPKTVSTCLAYLKAVQKQHLSSVSYICSGLCCWDAKAVTVSLCCSIVIDFADLITGQRCSWILAAPSSGIWHNLLRVCRWKAAQVWHRQWESGEGACFPWPRIWAIQHPGEFQLQYMLNHRFGLLYHTMCG